MAIRIKDTDVMVKKLVIVSGSTAVKKISVSNARGNSVPSIVVSTDGSITPKKEISEHTTFVRKIILGTPIRSIKQGDVVDAASLRITNLLDVDVSDPKNGDVLVFNSTTSNYENTKYLEEQYINGGQY